MITQVKFIGIPTRDQHKALQFYTTQLGFEVVTDQPFDAKQRGSSTRMPAPVVSHQRQRTMPMDLERDRRVVRTCMRSCTSSPG
ncbi:MAG TPA: VOC family protein [Steroidobacteraceae bacterium]